MDNGERESSMKFRTFLRCGRKLDRKSINHTNSTHRSPELIRTQNLSSVACAPTTTPLFSRQNPAFENNHSAHFWWAQTAWEAYIYIFRAWVPFYPNPKPQKLKNVAFNQNFFQTMKMGDFNSVSFSRINRTNILEQVISSKKNSRRHATRGNAVVLWAATSNGSVTAMLISQKILNLSLVWTLHSSAPPPKSVSS